MAKRNDDPSLFAQQSAAESSGPVECLGMTFPNDDERREHFLKILKDKLRDPEFRKIEGFPIGAGEDILAMSDPPYYTACPNPFLADFIKLYGKPYDPSKSYSREPFAVDVSEGKTDPIYKAHGYHTKVPHLCIRRSIGHPVAEAATGQEAANVPRASSAVPQGDWRLEQERGAAGALDHPGAKLPPL
jgi:hypothetical protein